MRPATLERAQLYARGLQRVADFLAHNRLPKLNFEKFALGPIKGIGVYKPEGYVASLSVRRTLATSQKKKNIPDRYDYPGSYHDSTALGWCGYLAAQHILNVMRIRYAPNLEPEPVILVPSDRWDDLLHALRLLIINPDLLHAGRPARYWYVTEAMRLLPSPLILRWETLLKDAPIDIRAGVHRWVADGRQAHQRR